MQTAIYNDIGKTYDSTRRADPVIIKTLYRLLQPQPSGKYRPHMYLDANVRAGISSFHVSAHQDEVEQGLEMLKKDIKSGLINTIIQQYESNVGDYLFVGGMKKEVM